MEIQEDTQPKKEAARRRCTGFISCHERQEESK